MSEHSSYKFRTLGEYRYIAGCFEKINDGATLPGLRLVIRIDARRYKRPVSCCDKIPLSWDSWSYPYASEIQEALIATARCLMIMGLRVTLAVVHGDEISALLDEKESATPRKRSMLLSLFSSAASLHFYEFFPCPVIFHGILSELPSEQAVLDYFFWQRRCFNRNMLSHLLSKITSEQDFNIDYKRKNLSDVPSEEVTALLTKHGLSAETQPDYMKFGSALWWEEQGSSSVPGYKIIQSRFLPKTDEKFLVFLKQRLLGVSYLAEENEEISFVDLGEDYRSVAQEDLQEDREVKSRNRKLYSLYGNMKGRRMINFGSKRTEKD